MLKREFLTFILCLIVNFAVFYNNIVYLFSNVKNYLLGTNENLIIHVIVENRGEDAFESSYNLQLPHGVNYVKIMQLGDLSIPVQCSPLHVNNTITLKCDIGNPLPKESLVSKLL